MALVERLRRPDEVDCVDDDEIGVALAEDGAEGGRERSSRAIIAYTVGVWIVQNTRLRQTSSQRGDGKVYCRLSSGPPQFCRLQSEICMRRNEPNMCGPDQYEGPVGP